MGYFANGTEWDFYYAAWCELCTHEENCPIIAIHLLAGAFRDDPNLKWACNQLIPVNGIENLNCTMFTPIEKPETLNWTRIDAMDKTTWPHDNQSVWAEYLPGGRYVALLNWNSGCEHEVAQWTPAPIPKPPEK